MNIIIHICNRQSGKTTEAFRLLSLDPDHTLIVGNSNFTRDIKYKYVKNAITNSNIQMHHAPEINTVIFDEFLFFSETDLINVRDFLNRNRNIKNIICFSSPRIRFDKTKFDFIKKIKTRQIRILTDYFKTPKLLIELKEINNNSYRSEVEELNYLYYSFITDPNVQIFHNLFLNKALYIAGDNPLNIFEDGLTKFKGEYLK